MSFKILNSTIIDDTRNLVAVGIATISTILAGSATTTGTVGQALQVGSAGSPNGAYISGNVGIGSTNPSSKLFIVGDSFVSGVITAAQLISNVAQGTAPITVGSSTLVNNLNVNYLNSQPGSYYQIANNLTGQAPAAVVTQSSGFTVTGNVSISGNLSVGGTSVALNVAQLQVKDRDIVLGITTDPTTGVDISTDVSSNHGGIAIASTEGSPLINIPLQAGINSNPFTYKQFMWIKSGNYSGLGTDVWLSNYAISIGNTATVQNGSRLTVGAGFTVFDTYLDATDIRARNITAVTNINSTGIITATTFSGNVNAGVGTITTLSGTNLNYTGISTITNIATNTNINSSGINTAAQFNILTTAVLSTVSSQIRLSGIATIDATTKATLERELAFAPNDLTDLNVSGISTLKSTTLIGGGTSTGTANQVFQVTGISSGAYIGGSLGIAVTNPTRTLDVNGDFRLRSGLYDFNNVVGAAGSILISTGAGVSWTTISGAGGASININNDTSTTTPLYLAFTSATTGTVSALNVDTSGLTFIPGGPGSLGIGTTSPTDNLDVNGTARLRSTLKDFNNNVGAAGSILISTGAGVSWTSITGAGGATAIVDDVSTTTPKYLLFTGSTSGTVTTENVSSTKLSYIASSGSLGIGTTSPTQELDVNGDFRLRAGLYDFNNNVGVGGSILISTGVGVSWTTLSNTGAISGINVSQDDTGIRYPLFASGTNATTTVQYIDATAIVYNTSTNCLGIGSLTPTSKLDIIGDIRVSGIITANDFDSRSDERLKINIKTITNPIEKVLQINGVTFNWKETGKATLGVIAQNIEVVLPELVSNTDPKTVNYNGLIGLLIECVKDQQKQIDELKNKF